MTDNPLETKHSRVLILLAVACTGIMLVIFFAPGLTVLDKLEYRTVDWRFQLRGPRAPADDIVIVAIDEESIGQVGKWPWSRRRLAELTQSLAECGARAIIYDIFFAEPDTSAGGAQSDAALVAATRRYPPVYHALYGHGSAATSPQVGTTSPHLVPYGWSEVGVTAGRGLNALATVYEFSSLGGPLPALAEVSAGLGFTDVIDSGDGVFRYVAPVAKCGEQLYPCLALTVAADVLEVQPEEITVRLGQNIDLGGLREVPLDPGGRMIINFAGPDHTYSHISAYQLLTDEDRSALPDLQDAIALVGATAPGLGDLRACPFDGVMVGVEMQANILDNIINAHFLKQVSPTKIALIILFVGLSIGAMFALVATSGAVAYAVAVLVSYNLACIWAFNTRGLIINMLAPTLTGLLIMVVMVTYKLTGEERRRQRVHHALSRFVPTQIVSQLVDEQALTTMQGQRRVVSVLFCDIRNFTVASERLAPEDTVSLLNRYFQLMHEVIWELGGTLDKFMGDGLMAFFNAPLLQPDHAQLAVATAIEMQRQIRLRQAEWEFYGMPSLTAGIGISTGEALVGCVSSRERMQYTVIGPHVNLAARLEELTKQFDAQILISESTYEQVKESVAAESVGEITVKGFAAPINVYSVKVAE